MKQVSTPFYVGPGALVSSSPVEDRAPVDRYRATIVRDDPGRRMDEFTFSVCVVEATSEAEAFELLVPPTGFRGEDAEEELAWSPILAPVMRLYLHRRIQWVIATGTLRGFRMGWRTASVYAVCG